MSAKIKSIKAREILDSRGNPTVETKVILENKITAKAAVPSGASTGVHEALELRDADEDRYFGKGVLKAVENVNTKIAPKLKAKDVTKQAKIDEIMIDSDGSDNKQNLGANAILSVSLACARAAARFKGIELYEYISNTYKFNRKKFNLPIPSFNIFNGGKHADTNLDFQEFMIMPVNCPYEDKPFAGRVRMGSEIFHSLGEVLRRAGFDTDVGAEGGYAPDINSSIQAVDLIVAAIIDAGYKPGEQIGIGTDVGSSELYNKETGKYVFKLDNTYFTDSSLVSLYYDWFKKYPIMSIEDGLAEDDWEGWEKLTRELGSEMLIVGDDLFVTNIKRLRKGLEKNAANTILIKPNQVGTLTETVECVKLAQKHNYKIMVSHRSGETCDNFIADLAVGVRAEFIKSGSLSRSERLSKYNRLMEIEEDLEEKENK